MNVLAIPPKKKTLESHTDGGRSEEISTRHGIQMRLSGSLLRDARCIALLYALLVSCDVDLDGFDGDPRAAPKSRPIGELVWQVASVPGLMVTESRLARDEYDGG